MREEIEFEQGLLKEPPITKEEILDSRETCFRVWTEAGCFEIDAIYYNRLPSGWHEFVGEHGSVVASVYRPTAIGSFRVSSESGRVIHRFQIGRHEDVRLD